jgi:hypothetical protein
MVLGMKCFHGVGAFEVNLIKVTALKLFHPSVCPVFNKFSLFSQLRHSLLPQGKKILGRVKPTLLETICLQCEGSSV